MSSKLKLKSTAGGSLSLIVDDTLATDEEMNISDGGIVSGSNANGNWIKYPDGTLIQYGIKTVTETTSTAWGNIFIQGTPTTVTYPINEFIAIPTFTIGGGYLGNGTASGWFQVHTVSISSANISGMSALTSFQGKCMWQAIGRWK